MSQELYTGKTEASYYHGHRLRRLAATQGHDRGRKRARRCKFLPVGWWRCDAADEEVELVARGRVITRLIFLF